MRYLDFSEEDFKKSVLDHLEGVATDIGRSCKGIDEIYLRVENGEFEGKLLACFQEQMPHQNTTVGKYHGAEVDSVVISDVKLPKAIEDAALEERVAEQRAKALKAEARGLNEAARVVQGRTPKGENPKISKEKAIELIQIQNGKSPKQIHEVEIGDNAREALKDVPLEFLKWFSPKKKGRRS